MGMHDVAGGCHQKVQETKATEAATRAEGAATETMILAQSVASRSRPASVASTAAIAPHGAGHATPQENTCPQVVVGGFLGAPWKDGMVPYLDKVASPIGR
ncbi:unnamed protein product [Prorocentrum cordatum]|uniref:Subtilisin n=1 Tax=Prorocentrum cordatum TaxID=2364126 RepID=A0ABN9WXT0_9DINO|nr:unnamed protein product [Polarella glacialis]